MPIPDPLPSDVVARLRTDPTAALAAALTLAGAFPDLVAWAMSAFSGKVGAADGKPKENGESNGVAKSNGAKKGARAKGGHSSREAAAQHDKTLLALMRANPEASTTEIIRLNGRPRNSTVLSLERLQKAGLVEHLSRGRWTAVDPDLLPPAPLKPGSWVEPLSGKHTARRVADGRARDEMSLA